MITKDDNNIEMREMINEILGIAVFENVLKQNRELVDFYFRLDTNDIELGFTEFDGYSYKISSKLFGTEKHLASNALFELAEENFVPQKSRHYRGNGGFSTQYFPTMFNQSDDIASMFESYAQKDTTFDYDVRELVSNGLIVTQAIITPKS